MLSTNLNIGFATAAVVAAFHGAANTMREIQERHQEKNVPADALARETLMHAALQTAAEQVARSYTVVTATAGPLFDSGNDTAKGKLIDISALIRSDVLRSLKIAKDYDDAVLDLERMHEDVIVYKRDALKILEDLRKEPEKAPRYIVRPESATIPDRSVERLSTSYSHHPPQLHTQRSRITSYSPDFQPTHLVVEEDSPHRLPEEPKQQPKVKSSYGSRIFKNRNLSILRRKQDPEKSSQYTWYSDATRNNFSASRPKSSGIPELPDSPTTNVYDNTFHDDPHATSDLGLLPSMAYGGSQQTYSTTVARLSDASDYSDKIPVDSQYDNLPYPSGVDHGNAYIEMPQPLTPTTPLSPSRGPLFHDYIPEHAAANWASPLPASALSATSPSTLQVQHTLAQHYNPPMGVPAPFFPPPRITSPTLYQPQRASAPFLQPQQVSNNIPWSPSQQQQQMSRPLNHHSVRTQSSGSSGYISVASLRPPFFGTESLPPSVASEIVGRPEKSNGYWGFCKGSWTARENPLKAFHIKLIPVGMYTRKEQWSCKQCSFAGESFRRGKQKTFDPRVTVDPDTTLRFRFLFLAKSHVKCKGDDVSYGCVFCVDEARKTSIYGNTATLMQHILAEHLTMREDIARKNKVVYGAVEGQVWDLNFPEETPG